MITPTNWQLAAASPLANHRRLLWTLSCLLPAVSLETQSRKADTLISEWLSWALLFASIELYRLIWRRPGQATAEVYDEAETSDVELLVAGAIVVSSACEQQSSVGWVTPIIAILLDTCRVPSISWLPILDRSLPSTHQTKFSIVGGLLSAAALLTQLPFGRFAILSLCFALCQWIIFSGIPRIARKDNTVMLEKQNVDIYGLARSIVLRVLTLLTLLNVIYPSTFVFDFGTLVGSLLRSIHWAAIYLLLLEAPLSIAPNISTFAIATNAARTFHWPFQAIAAAASALQALFQIVTLQHGNSKTSRVLWLFSILPLWFLLSTKSTVFSTGPWHPIHWNILSSQHPIEILMADAKARHSALLQSQSQTLDEAVVEYRRRYKRPPPRGFDSWFNIAKSQNVVIIDNFDTITKSFEPFWGLPPSVLRDIIQEVGKDLSQVFDIKSTNGNFSSTSGDFFLFGEILKQIEPYMGMLPELPVPMLVNRLHNHDLPRVVIPHDILDYLKHGSQLASLQPLSNTKFHDFRWIDLHGQPTLDTLTLSCPPDAPIRWHRDEAIESSGISFMTDISGSMDICSHPDLRYKHGAWSAQSGDAQMITHTPVPIFSTSRLTTHHDIIIPSPYYWNDFRRYSPTSNESWHSKKNTLYWAGSTTGVHLGGSRDWHNTPSQRHRFVELVNDLPNPRNVTLMRKTPSNKWTTYESPMSSQSHLYNVHFSQFVQCDDAACEKQKEYFEKATESLHWSHFGYRFLFDLDGNGFSGRYYRFLESNATIFKQTIFQEWHDEFITPWLHYVPVSMGMEELPELMRFFAQTEEGEKRAWEIAREGGEWARKALRREDTSAGFMRALLEYARVVDDRRDEMSCC